MAHWRVVTGGAEVLMSVRHLAEHFNSVSDELLVCIFGMMANKAPHRTAPHRARAA